MRKITPEDIGSARRVIIDFVDKFVNQKRASSIDLEMERPSVRDFLKEDLCFDGFMRFKPGPVISINVRVELKEEEVRLNPFPCHACEQHKEGILIRGLCRDCAPGLHKKHDRDAQFMSDMNIKFKEETGKDSLEDWHGFEDWLEKERGKK